MFDMRGGGFIRSEDMNEALQSIDIKLTEEELAELFDGMDVDGKTNTSVCYHHDLINLENLIYLHRIEV